MRVLIGVPHGHGNPDEAPLQRPRPSAHHPLPTTTGPDQHTDQQQSSPKPKTTPTDPERTRSRARRQAAPPARKPRQGGQQVLDPHVPNVAARARSLRPRCSARPCGWSTRRKILCLPARWGCSTPSRLGRRAGLGHPDDPTGPFWIRLDRRGTQPEQPRSGLDPTRSTQSTRLRIWRLESAAVILAVIAPGTTRKKGGDWTDGATHLTCEDDTRCCPLDGWEATHNRR
jgi:hypothetical protein